MKHTDAITFLPTQDLEKTHDFYVNKLDLTLRLNQGKCHIYEVAENAHFGFCTTLDPLPNPDQVILTIVTDEVDELYTLCQALHLKVDNIPRKNEDFNIYHFFVTDPNGYRLEFQTFLDPDWKNCD